LLGPRGGIARQAHLRLGNAGQAIVNPAAQTQITFITGTDTGVGKTLLTGLLLCHLRADGRRALAMKPFCSGSTADVDFLHGLQGGELTRDEINPFFFEEPLAPLVAARQHQVSIPMQEVLRRIARSAARCEHLLIEGSGGLLVPLGQGYLVADLIAKLNCKVIVVSANRLGTINHTLLTVRSLQVIGIQSVSVVLMDQALADASANSNREMLGELLGKVPVHEIPFLGQDPMRPEALKATEKKLKKTLAGILT
jgi:dethiobiotin synthetase